MNLEDLQSTSSVSILPKFRGVYKPEFLYYTSHPDSNNFWFFLLQLALRLHASFICPVSSFVRISTGQSKDKSFLRQTLGSCLVKRPRNTPRPSCVKYKSVSNKLKKRDMFNYQAVFPLTFFSKHFLRSSQITLDPDTYIRSPFSQPHNKPVRRYRPKPARIKVTLKTS